VIFAWEQFNKNSITIPLFAWENNPTTVRLLLRFLISTDGMKVGIKILNAYKEGPRCPDETEHRCP
jgi:hypothetical protein